MGKRQKNKYKAKKLRKKISQKVQNIICTKAKKFHAPHRGQKKIHAR